jgi:hypothetical protein
MIDRVRQGNSVVVDAPGGTPELGRPKSPSTVAGADIGVGTFGLGARPSSVD